jgi:hypothetical protein
LETGMASTSARAASRVEWLVRSVTVSGLTLAVPRLRIHLYLATASTGPPPAAESAWVDTGAPLSVIPFHVHQQGLRWQPIPGIRATWSGQPCDLGRIDVWLPVDQPPAVRGPFSLLAKVPRSDPPGDPVPVLLGLEFFLAYQAGFVLFPPPQDGRILLP